MPNKQVIKKVIKIASIAILAILLLVIYVRPVHASILGDVASAIGEAFLGILLTAASLVAGFLSYLIGFIASIIFTIGSSMLNWGLTLNQGIISTPLVNIGFSITLGLANLGFVLAIIVIAFATILRIQTYGMKQILWKLILAAVLVNFSLTIAGLVLDFTGVISDFFINKASSGGGGTLGFTANLAKAFNPQGLLVNTNQLEAIRAAGSFGSSLITVIANIFFMSFFTVFLAIGMLGTAALVFIRYLYISMLLILMPLAWLFWIFPNLSHLSKKWWDKFIKWVFFLPAAMFFLYLALKSVEMLSEFGSLNAVGITDENNILTGDFLANIGQMILVLALLVGGLIVANSMSIAGASAVSKIAQGVRGWAIGKAGKLAMKPVTTYGQKVSNLLTKPSLRWIPGAKGAASILAAKASRSKEIEEYQRKNLNSLTPAQREQIYKSGLPVGAVAKSALLASASKEGKLKQLLEGQDISLEQKQKRLEQFVIAAKQTHPGMEVKDIPEIKDIKNTDIPLFAKITGQNIKDIVDRTASKDIAKQSGEALANPEFLAALNNKQIEQAAKTGVTAILNQLKIGVAALKTQQPEHPNIPLLEEGIIFQGKKPKEKKQEKAETVVPSIIVSSEVPSKRKEGGGIGINKENL